MPDLLIFVILVGVIAVGGIRLGILLAPRVGQVADRIDADPGDEAEPEVRAEPDPAPNETETRDDA